MQATEHCMYRRVGVFCSRCLYSVYTVTCLTPVTEAAVRWPVTSSGQLLSCRWCFSLQFQIRIIEWAGDLCPNIDIINTSAS